MKWFIFGMVSIFAIAQANAGPTSTQVKKALTAKEKKLDGVLKGLQGNYENTTTFDAQFEQRYTYALLKKTNKSTGRVSFQKPGQMRWDYSAPEVKSFIISQESLWIYQPEDHFAMVNRCFKQDGLTTSISFLWGAGNLRETFHVSFFKGQFGIRGDHNLLLIPKETNTIFAKLILVVHPKTFAVKQSILIDHQGNLNRFTFKKQNTNQPFLEDHFSFRPPSGTHVTPMPGTCKG
jgi:outer membrane lipoprotein carrier protein